MKRYLKVIPFLLLAILVAVPAYSQSASISGKVIGRDGQPAANIQLKIDELSTNNGRLTVRESLPGKTGRNGEYSLSGLYPGRVMVSVMENGVAVLVAGEKIGDEIYLADGLDKRIPTFDLTKAPPPAAAAPAGAANNSGMTAAERDAMKKKLEAAAAAEGEVRKAFDAGKAAYAAKDYPEAIKNLKLALEKSPLPSDVILANLAQSYDANKQYDEAIAAYTKATELKPTDSNYFLNLSLAQIGAGKVDESKASIAKSASLDPANGGKAYYNLAASLINRQKYDEAIDPLKKAIELDPKYGPAYFQLGLTLVQKGKLDEAPAYLQKCLDLGAGCPDSVTAKGLIDGLKAASPTAYQSDDVKLKAEKAEADKNKAKTPAKGGKN